MGSSFFGVGTPRCCGLKGRPGGKPKPILRGGVPLEKKTKKKKEEEKNDTPTSACTFILQTMKKAPLPLEDPRRSVPSGLQPMLKHGGTQARSIAGRVQGGAKIS